MPSTYSSSLRLELMAQGENANTWGNKTNTNLDKIEQALVGRYVVSVSATTDTYILSVVDSSATQDSPGRNAIIEIVGAATSAKTVQVPDISKSYWVYASTGGTLTFKSSAGTGLVLPQNRWSLVLVDSTTAVNALPAATESLQGQLEIATQVEANAGTDNTRALTPANLTNIAPTSVIAVASDKILLLDASDSNKLKQASYPIATPVINVYASTTAWTCPEGVTRAYLVVVGGGGGGGAESGGTSGQWGGNGGIAIALVTVSAGEIYTLTVGVGGSATTSAGVSGTESWFGTTATSKLVRATGGAGGAQGTYGTYGKAISGAGTGNLKSFPGGSIFPSYDLNANLGGVLGMGLPYVVSNDVSPTYTPTMWTSASQYAAGTGGAQGVPGGNYATGGVGGAILLQYWV